MSEDNISQGDGSQDGDPKFLVIPDHCINLREMLSKLDAISSNQLFQERAYTANGDWVSILTHPPPTINWEMCRVTHQLHFSPNSKCADWSGGLLVETHTRDAAELEGKGLKRNLVVSLNQGGAWCIQPIVTTRSQLGSLMDREQNENNPLNLLPLVGMRNIDLEELDLIIQENLAPPIYNPTHQETLELLQRDPLFPNDLFIGVIEEPLPSPDHSIVTVSPKLINKRDRLVKGKLPQYFNEFEVDHPAGGRILQQTPAVGGGCTPRGSSSASS